MMDLIDLLKITKKQKNILNTLYTNKSLNLSNLSKECNISRSTCHSSLKALIKINLVEKIKIKGESIYTHTDKNNILKEIEKNVENSYIKLKVSENIYQKIKKYENRLNTPNVKIIKRNYTPQLYYNKYKPNSVIELSKNITPLLINNETLLITNKSPSLSNIKNIEIEKPYNDFYIFIHKYEIIIFYGKKNEYIKIESIDITNFFKIKFKLIWENI